MASRPFAGASRPMHRPHATAKLLQSMGLLQMAAAKKRQRQPRRRCFDLFRPGFQNGKATAGGRGFCPAGGCAFDEVPMCSKKSGTGVEREPDAESLLAGGAFGSPQLLRNL